MSYREGKYAEWMSSSEKSESDFMRFLNKNAVAAVKDGGSWARRYMGKADHNLDFAVFVGDLHRDLIREKFPGKTFYDWVTTAYYYAVYHAALALLAKSGFRSRSHMATLCGVITYYFHGSKSLDRKHIEILGRIERRDIEQFIESQKLRERASYGISLDFEERLAAMARKDAVEFVNKARQILGKSR
jgi:uncharacterized protein (UPF0332 family)